MTASNPTQTSFLGGEWGLSSQGRFDLPGYATALDTSANGLTLEDGVWTRRPGFINYGNTYFNSPGILRKLIYANNDPHIVELTWYATGSTSQIRFWHAPYNSIGRPSGDPQSATLLADDYVTVASISGANPAVITHSARGLTWNVGDIVCFYTDVLDPVATNGHELQNRQFYIATKPSNTTITVKDCNTGTLLDGATVSYTAGTLHIGRVLTLTAPYTSNAEIQAVRLVQVGSNVMFLCPTQTPYLLTQTVSASTNMTSPTQISYTFASAGFTSTSAVGPDGPYLDPLDGSSQLANATATVSAGTTTPTISSMSGYTLVAADAGRQIRLFSIPAAWAVGTTYAAGACVYYGGLPWINSSGASQVGIYPGSDITWLPAPQQAKWTYGVITTVNTGAQTATLLLSAGVDTTNNGTTIDTWQLGVYTSGQYPSAGAYHEGRLILVGAAAGRFDTSMSNGLITTIPKFSPTSIDGTVADNHGISYIINQENPQSFVWVKSDRQGCLMGTPNKEWLIYPPSANALTPTNIKAVEITPYGSPGYAGASGGTNGIFEPVRAGNVILMLNRVGDPMELYPDAFSVGRFIGKLLNPYSKHISNLLEFGYAEHGCPIIWGWSPITNQFYSCTYRRFSTFSNEPPTVCSWATHSLGNTNLTIESMIIAPAAGSSVTGSVVVGGDGISSTNDTPVFMVSDSSSGFRFVHRMYQVNLTAEKTQTAQATARQSWPLDNAFNGLSATESVAATGPLLINGLKQLAGQTVSAYIAGLDCGDFTVSAAGVISVPYGSHALLTQAYLAAFPTTASLEPNYGWGPQACRFDLTVAAVLTKYTIPVVIGQSYTSQGKLLRPMAEQVLKTKTGSGLAMSRRAHMYGLLVTAAQSLSVGTDFTTMYAAPLQTYRGGPALAGNLLFNGVLQDTLNNDETFDGQLCWQITRPTICFINAATTFLDTEERNVIKD